MNYDANDRFCMNGQRLVAISGTYGADSTEYRTEIDGFSRVISYGNAGAGPAYFKVWTKAGQIMEFGNTADSRPLASDGLTARSWEVDKISDVKGNYLTVNYTNDSTNGQNYPIQINYTGNANAGLAPYNSVRFVYNTARPDVTPLYHAGSVTQITVLLTDIKTFQGSNLVYDYQLQYRLGSATTHSRLTQVTLCDSGGTDCLAPTTFGWQGGTGTLSYTTSNPGFDNGALFGDFNGDGLTDAYSLPYNVTYNENGSSPNSTSSVEANSTLYQGQEGGGFATSTVTLKYGYYCSGAGCGPPCNIPYSGCTLYSAEWAGMIDYRGNGLSQSFLSQWYSEIPGYGEGTQNFEMSTDNSGNMAAILSVGGANGPPSIKGDFNGDGTAEFFGSLSCTYTGYSCPSVTWPSTTSSAIYPADFSGNGCTDVLLQGSINAIDYNCNNAVSSITVPYWTSSYGPNDTIILGDFNGDGIADILLVNPNGNGTLDLSTGTGYVTSSFVVPQSWSGNQILTGDFNGDGKTDIAVGSIAGGWNVYLSTGSGFVLAATLPAPAGCATTVPTSTTCAQAADVNSDGATDLIIGNTVYTFAYTPELISSVSNGIGATTTITYDRLNRNGSFYTKCPNNPSTYNCGDPYPTLDVDGPLYVVSRIDASNGIGGTFSKTYAYAGGKSDLRGRGLLGFSSITVTDLNTGVVQTTNNHTDFPYVGLVASQTATSGSVTLNSTSNTYTDSIEGTGTDGVPYHFVSLSQRAVTSNDLDGTALPSSATSYTYDSYGNVLTNDISVSDGSSKDTTNTYTNDTTNWLLGQLTNTSVTSTVPDRGVGGSGGVQPPVANNDSVTANENTATTFDPRSNDTDSGGYSLTIISTSAPSHGIVTINNGTSLTYTPANMYSGNDSFTYTISDGQGNTATATISVTVAYVPPPSGTFTANGATIDSGSSSTLSWTSSGATSASIDNGIGNVTPVAGGSVNVTPTTTTTYTLTLTGTGGTTTKQVTVTVVGTSSGSFSAGAGTITAGSSTTLNWTSNGAVSAAINNGVGNVTPVAGGSVTVSPSATTTYTLTLTNAAGTNTTYQATVTVVAAPTGTFSAGSGTITAGRSTTLNWSSSSAVSASINDGVGNVTPVASGSATVSPASTTTYTLTLTNAAGTTATYQATITVVAAPSGSFSASSGTITAGHSTTLNWASSNAASASISNGVGNVTPVAGGSVTVSPSASTTYTLTLVNSAGGSTTYQATVTVVAAPSGSLSANPATIPSGNSSTLVWSSSSAVSASINNGIGNVTPAAGGSLAVSPTTTTTYTLTLTNAAGTQTTYQATVTVTPVFNQTIQVTGSGPVNLLSLASSAGYNGSEDATINFVVGSGVTIMGSPGGVGIDTGTWPTGSYTIKLTLTVNGTVDGGGGAGGRGGSGSGGFDGGAGSDAIYCRTPITVVVNGAVQAGGGGGGGGGTSPAYYSGYGGGGGGGGFPNGPGGAGGTGTLIIGGGNGSPGTTSGGGNPGYPSSGPGGGGDGGGAGMAGGAGGAGSSPGGAGGASGYAIRMNGNSVSLTINGSIIGPRG